MNNKINYFLILDFDIILRKNNLMKINGKSFILITIVNFIDIYSNSI